MKGDVLPPGVKSREELQAENAKLRANDREDKLLTQG
jgi:hypothetical protein